MQQYKKKFSLSAQEYNYLASEMRSFSCAERQTIYYFDTEEYAMHQKGMECCICENSHGCIATVKTYPSYGGITEREEQALGRWDTHLFSGLNVTFKGTVTTDRIPLFKDERYAVLLCKNTYLGETDYELELVYQLNSISHAIMFLETIALRLSGAFSDTSVYSFFARSEHEQSKAERFFEKLISTTKK